MTEAWLGLAIAMDTVPILGAGLTIRLFFYGAYGASVLCSLAGIGVVSVVMAALLMAASGMVWWNAVPKTPTWGIRGQRLSRSWMVQGGLVMERGQRNELVQSRHHQAG